MERRTKWLKEPELSVSTVRHGFNFQTVWIWSHFQQNIITVAVGAPFPSLEESSGRGCFFLNLSKGCNLNMESR